MKRCLAIFTLSLLVSASLCLPGTVTGTDMVDPGATKLLKRMSDYLSGLQQFSVNT